MHEITVPFDKAVELCKLFREKHKVRMFSQCWGCLRFSNGDSKKMCFYQPPNNRGCKFVNQLYDHAVWETIVR
ncbi:MAG: hypothetical protein NWE95_04175 [Candidatus Bathyarchaeota archaeon]|nr:hypothetical protein [Candidatus Bathyarchaeota archaeon]